MNKFIKTINRYNGNLCFVGATESNDIIYECDRFNKSIVSVPSSKRIFSVCHQEADAYFVSFSDEYIGLFQAGVLNDTYITSTISNIDRLASRRDGVFYALKRSIATIYRFTVAPFSIDWTLQIQVPLTAAQENGEIIVRESDDALIYYDDEQIFLIGDLGTSGSLANKINIGDGSGIFVEAASEFKSDYTFLRWRQVVGEEIAWSSSSSSSSSNSSSSSSSSNSSSSSSG